MDELSLRISQFVKDNLLAVLCFVAGLILLSSGLIAFSGSRSQETDVVFESLSDRDENNGDKESVSESRIVVDVSGAVNKPGVYRLSDKSRIEDAILAAGGVSANADKGYIAKNVNLASLLSDGAKIYLPFSDQDAVNSDGVLGIIADDANRNFLNINTATSLELEALPGIGEVTAGKIIRARPYTMKEELLSRKIVSQKVYEQIKEKVSVW